MFELTLEANLDNLDDVLAFVDTHLEEAGCSMRTQTQIDIAVEELFVNIASYAYIPDKGDATVRIDTETEPGTVSITLIDSGIPYDPLSRPDPDITLSAEERQIGGLGIYMVKKSMDGMFYSRENGHNVLTIRKKL